jgi:ATP-dependent Lon protease
LSDSEGILPFDATGVAELVRTGARIADDQRKFSTAFSHVADVAREADYWARQEGEKTVTRSHVRKAVDERVYRSDLIAEKIRELISDGTLLIDLAGASVGQVNGLSVADLGDYSFGRPSRVTASVGIGAAGIVNIERESHLSGRTFNKGMLILEGYLRGTYSRDQPLALTAGIAMEQSYGGIDGDSASVAELLCLLSALAEVPLRQDVAVTGSINQRGEMQAVGAINDKIEGFFDVCRSKGLSGTQGVCIPAANVKNLILRPDVIDAMSRGQFYIWAASHVEQAMQLLSGIPAGKIDDVQSFHGRVMQRLKGMSEVLERRRAPSDKIISMPVAPSELPTDPRPPMPGRS